MAKSLQARQDAEQRELLFAAVDASDQIVMITGADQLIVYVNGAFTRVTGYAPSEALGRNPGFLQGPGTSQATRGDLRQAIEKGTRVSAEILNYRKSGEPYWVDVSIVPVGNRAGAITHWIAIEREVTARKTQEQEITRLAMEDHLTGLPNRRAAETRLQVEWSRARRNGSTFAVALVDVDRFKLVNDQYGHHVGDLALVHLAKLLASNMRGGDWIARWGGEEFLACFNDLDASGALTAGERVRKLVRGKPVKLQQGDLPLTVSAGIALCGPTSDSLDAVLASADALLYQAKQTGRDKVLCAGVSRGRRGSSVWEGSQVQTALHEGRVVPAYQPIVELRSGDVVGEEALARIVSAGNSPIAAQRFIVAAEQLRLVAAIDQTVSQRALERVAGSGKKGEGKARLINLSAQFLGDPGHVSALLGHARALGLLGNGHANPVVIEITERQTDDLVGLQRDLQPLVDAGFRLALDDFGSGYSSFMYLTDLPMSFLKIEGWMVGRIAGDPRIRQLVESIVNTAARFELKTIAECVETSESAQVLRDIGVDWAQGHYFAKPQMAQ
jgi:diguanylate cyclase (GGDEF)-like protein/PAS domain S-box-containing protein